LKNKANTIFVPKYAQSSLFISQKIYKTFYIILANFLQNNAGESTINGTLDGSTYPD
jgi:hypothetical protein